MTMTTIAHDREAPRPARGDGPPRARPTTTGDGDLGLPATVGLRPRRGVAALVLLGCVVSAVAAVRYVASHRTRPPRYQTAPIARRDLVGRTMTSGTLSAIVTIQVGTQVSGRIQTLSADFNSPVHKGQIIARLDAQLFEAAVQQARANHAAAMATLTSATATARNAEKQAARARILRGKDLASEADLDTAEANAAIAQATIEGARASLAQAAAQLHQAEINLSYTKIVAPIDGVVISRNVDVGQTVAASLATPTLFTIAQDLTKMQVDTNVAEGDVGRLQAGMETSFTVDSYPDERFFGVVRQIRNAATTVQSVVTYDAVIDVDNRALRLRPGMTANVTIVYARRPGALVAPSAAFRFHPPAPIPARAESPGARTLWGLRDGVLRPVVVRTGLADGSFTEVLDAAATDLKDGDEVVLQTTGGGGGSAPSSPRPPGLAGRPPPMF